MAFPFVIRGRAAAGFQPAAAGVCAWLVSLVAQPGSRSAFVSAVYQVV